MNDTPSTPSPTVVLPAVDTGVVASGLYELSKVLCEANPEAQAHGLFGGEYGYGQHYSNECFTMRPFYWGDCECPRDAAEAVWDADHDHTADCYQTELGRRGYDQAEVLAREWGLSAIGCAVHCTCGHDQAYAAWDVANPHDVDCGEVAANFCHHTSGFEVRWYKYIGRSMESNRPIDAAEWTSILDECLRSVANQPT